MSITACVRVSVKRVKTYYVNWTNGMIELRVSREGGRTGVAHELYSGLNVHGWSHSHPLATFLKERKITKISENDKTEKKNEKKKEKK